MSTTSRKERVRRSKCPISSTLELVGDRWSLLILRDILFYKKVSYHEFLESAEGISTNILKDRLISLTETGLIGFTGLAKRKKYHITETGMDLLPVIESLCQFGSRHFKGSKEYLEGELRRAGRQYRGTGGNIDQ